MKHYYLPIQNAMINIDVESIFQGETTIGEHTLEIKKVTPKDPAAAMMGYGGGAGGMGGWGFDPYGGYGGFGGYGDFGYGYGGGPGWGGFGGGAAGGKMRGGAGGRGGRGRGRGRPYQTLVVRLLQAYAKVFTREHCT